MRAKHVHWMNEETKERRIDERGQLKAFEFDQNRSRVPTSEHGGKAAADK